MFTCTLQTNTHIFTNQSRHTHHFFLSGNSFPTPRSTLTSLCSQGMFGSNMFMLTGYKCTHRSGLSWTPTIALLNSVIQCVFECGLSPHCAWSSACNWNNLCCNTMGNKEVTWRFVFLVFTCNADVLGGGGGVLLRSKAVCGWLACAKQDPRFPSILGESIKLFWGTSSSVAHT